MAAPIIAIGAISANLRSPVCLLFALIYCDVVMYLEESKFFFFFFIFFFSFFIAYQKVKLGVTTVVSNKKVFWKWECWNQTSMLQNMWFVS